MIYLAIPYTWNPDKSFEIVNKVAAKLMSDGEEVFSPISHSHCIANYLPEHLRTDQEFWMKQDIPMVQKADELKVVIINNDMGLLWDSKGVQQELVEAKKLNIPITFYYYDEA